MRKSILLCLLCLASVGAMAQNVSVKIQDTQARLLDVQSNGYVKPLVVELEVDTAEGRICKAVPISEEEYRSMNRDPSNIRSYALYKTSKDYNCDVIVAATFNFYTNEKGGGYIMEVIGYPASFKGWKSAKPEDYEWIRMEKVQTTADRDKIQAIIK